MDKVKNILFILKGMYIFSLVFLITLALFCVWVIKDQRHFSFIILDRGCNLQPITDEQQAAYDKFRPE